jgi:hypothetical protein
VFGELPAACLAEEIDAGGAARIRALITVAGNPVLSTPNGGRLDRALASLDFMVSLDIYLNETTRHADVILPGISTLEQSHYDLALRQLAIRNVATYSPAVFAPPRISGPNGRRSCDWPESWRARARRPTSPRWTTSSPSSASSTRSRRPGSSIHGRDPHEIVAALAPRRGPERMLDFLLRTGPYGDAFGARPDGLTLAVLEAHPHGLDFGALEPRIPEVLRTPSARSSSAPEPLVADVARLRADLERRTDGMVLDRPRATSARTTRGCTTCRAREGQAALHGAAPPADAARLGLADGALARASRRAPARSSAGRGDGRDHAGVVSIPHGWGTTARHGAPRRRGARGREQQPARRRGRLDPLSGNAVLNGIPVRVRRRRPRARDVSGP